MAKQPPIFDSHAAAEYLGLSVDTIRKYVQRRILTPQQTIGVAYVFSRSELDRYLRDRRPVGSPQKR